MSVREIESAWKKPLYVVNDFVYSVDKRVGDKWYCRCVRSKADNCFARITITKVTVVSNSR